MTYDCERCHWDKQKAQHFKDCPCKCHETIEAVPDIPRCEKCQWPLAKSVEEGCVPGNCSMRPVPKKHAEDSVKFWSDKYDAKVDELHEMWKEARSFEGSFNAAAKSIANQMGIIDRLTKETFDLKKEIVHLKESRSKWAKQSSENADLYEKAISPTQPSPNSPQIDECGTPGCTMHPPTQPEAKAKADKNCTYPFTECNSPKTHAKDCPSAQPETKAPQENCTCGHSLSDHQTPGSECVAKVKNGNNKDFCKCSCFVKSETKAPQEREAQEWLGEEALHHIRTMYPGLWEKFGESAKKSLKNFINNNFKAALTRKERES